MTGPDARPQIVLAARAEADQQRNGFAFEEFRGRLCEGCSGGHHANGGRQRHALNVGHDSIPELMALKNIPGGTAICLTRMRDMRHNTRSSSSGSGMKRSPACVLALILWRKDYYCRTIFTPAGHA